MLDETKQQLDYVLALKPADFLERLAAIEAKERAAAKLQKDYGITFDELKMAFLYFKERVDMYSKRGLTDGFRRIDTDHKGSLQGEELRKFFMEDAHCPWYCNDRTINVLVDFADLNNDDSIGYLELSNVIECEDIIQFAALVPNKKANSQEKKDREMKIGSLGCTVGQIKDAQQLIVKRLIERGSGDLRQNNLRSVLAYLDTYENGMITRAEFKAKLKPLNLIKHVTPEKKVKGELEDNVVETLLDIVDEVASKPKMSWLDEEVRDGAQFGAIRRNSAQFF